MYATFLITLFCIPVKTEYCPLQSWCISSCVWVKLIEHSRSI